MRLLRSLHPRPIGNAVKISVAELLAGLVLGIGVAMFVGIALFVLVLAFGWHFYKLFWSKLVAEIETAAKINAEKQEVAAKAEEQKAQPAAQTANEIINEVVSEKP